MAAFLTSICRAVWGDELNTVEIHFQHADSPCEGDYENLFRCPVRFNSEASAILLTRSDVDKPLLAANRELARAYDKILADFLKKLRKDGLITRVKTAVAEELPSGSPSREDALLHQREQMLDAIDLAILVQHA